MPYRYNHRFVFDSNFFSIIKDNYILFDKMTRITVGSQEHKKRQNIISVKSRDKIIQDYNVDIEVLRYFLNKYPDVDAIEYIEQIDDEIERTIKYAIHLKGEKPYSVIIFTSDEKKRTMLKILI